MIQDSHPNTSLFAFAMAFRFFPIPFFPELTFPITTSYSKDTYFVQDVQSNFRDEVKQLISIFHVSKTIMAKITVFCVKVNTVLRMYSENLNTVMCELEVLNRTHKLGEIALCFKKMFTIN